MNAAQPAPLPPRPPTLPEPLTDREAHDPTLRWLVHLGLPMLISLCLHAGLFGALAFTTWQLIRESPPRGGEYEAGIADSGASIGGSFQWPGDLSLSSPASNLPQAAEPAALSDLSSLSRMKLDQSSPASDADLGGGFGLGGPGRSAILGIGSGAGESGGAGLGSGLGAGQGVGRAGVWGIGDRCDRCGYVVDFSGSIVVAVDDLKRELKRSIGSLAPSQLFNVFIFFSTGGDKERFVTESYSPEFQPARPEARSSFFSWIDRKSPMGSTEPLAAVRRALAGKPDAIFFFSDGYFDESVVEEILRANRSVKARIHCLVFDELLLQDTSGLPHLTDGARRMQRIADASGGKLKIVTASDLKRR